MYEFNSAVELHLCEQLFLLLYSTARTVMHWGPSSPVTHKENNKMDNNFKKLKKIKTNFLFQIIFKIRE